MGELFEGWTSSVEDAYLLCTPENPEILKFHYFTKKEDDKPRLTPDEEIEEMNRQIDSSEGFDIDFSMFRCLFNYHLVDPKDSDFVKGITNGVLIKMLSLESLKIYNHNSDTAYEFVDVVKANFHFSCGYMFLITFRVLDHSHHKKQKTFQARVRYTSHHPTEYVFCRPKPDPQAESDENSNSEEDSEVESDDSSDESSEEDVKDDSNGTSDEDIKD